MAPDVLYLAADYAWLQVAPEDLIRAGYNGGAFRYISHDGSKDATAPEIANLHGAGLPIAFMYESTEGRSREGKQAGIDDGNFFNDRLAQLGVPDHVCRRTTTDGDGGDECVPYYEGWLQACPKTRFRMRGNYGSGYLTRRLKQLGLIDPGGGWQTLSKGFRESTPTNFAYVDVVQDFPSRGMNGWSASEWKWDENRIYVKDWGAWYPPGWRSDDDEEDDVIQVRPGDPLTIIPLKGTSATIRIAADFQPAKVRVAFGKDDPKGGAGPIEGGPTDIVIPRGQRRINVKDATWVSIKSYEAKDGGAYPVGVSVDYA